MASAGHTLCVPLLSECSVEYLCINMHIHKHNMFMSDMLLSQWDVLACLHTNDRNMSSVYVKRLYICVCVCLCVCVRSTWQSKGCYYHPSRMCFC